MRSAANLRTAVKEKRERKDEVRYSISFYQRHSTLVGCRAFDKQSIITMFACYSSFVLAGLSENVFFI